ncbi:MAG: type II secretion system F family protein [Clostridia bacterium]
MYRYSYKAVDIDNKKSHGQYLANNEEHLKALLDDEELFLVSAKQMKNTTPNSFFTLSGRVKMKDIAVFCKQFANMFSSGIEIVEVLSLLSTQPYPQMFKLVIQTVLMDVNSGMFLSDAMRKHKKIFPEFFVSMVAVGEASGKLDDIFQKMAVYYENQIVVHAKLVSAAIYPIFLIFMTFGIIGIVSAFVVPQFQKVFAELNLELPVITQMLFDFTELVKKNWMYILIGIVSFIGIIFLVKRTKKGKYFFDKLITKLPLFGKLAQSNFTARFARCFSTLLGSGIQVVTAMEILATLLGNSYYEAKFMTATEDVKRGITITRAFRRIAVFPPMLLQMVSVGERTGTLDETLDKTSTIFDQQQSEAISRVTMAIQPALVIFIAVFIMIVLLAIFVPMMEITGNLG